jgi:hypothetical protein
LLWLWRARRWIVAAMLVAIAAVVAYAIHDLCRDEPEAFFDRPGLPNDPIKQLKYGSTGGDRLAGIPVGIFKALPQLCRDYLPGDGWQSLGFIYEDGMDRPVGTSLRRSLGFERVSLNCGTCHVGTYRANATDRPTVQVGMPANKIDLAAFTHFVTRCVLDERFNPWQVMQASDRAGVHYSWFKRLVLGYVAVPVIKLAVTLVQYRFRFFDHEPEPGPGRFDTFNPAKALLNWHFESLPKRESVGLADFPSLWRQEQRNTMHMHLHWDGNNVSVDERNRSAAFGSGAVPTTLDRRAFNFIGKWLRSADNRPPKYAERIEPINDELSARGHTIYAEYCADCHGASGDDFSGKYVGKVDDISHVGTDPCRLDNYTYELALEQNNLYAGFPDERFRHFRKTNGYANMPLDGLWLRGPYLHNGSVPTVRDLLEPSANRPNDFYRGYDIIDRKKLGFISNVAEADGVKFFHYETRCIGDADYCKHQENPENVYQNNACAPGGWAGNGNRGHEGKEYGTELSVDDKDALVEYLKTF